MNRLIWASLLVTLLALPAFSAPRQIAITAPSNQVQQYHRIEFSLDGAVAANSYDPDEVDYRVEIKLPSGKQVSIPAFYYQPYDRRPLNRGGTSSEWLYPASQPVWKARFAPAEVGDYTCTAVLKDRSGTDQSQPFAFRCTPSDDKGFIRVSRSDPRYMEFDRGAPFFAVGQNVAFVYNSYATVEKLRKLGENGANFARVWACAEDWAMAIEARKSAFGRSWDWNPPIVLSPDRAGFHAWDLCLKLTGDAGAALHLSPCHSVPLRPGTKYRLSGQVRLADPATTVELDLGTRYPISGKREWTRFQQEFTAGPNQSWLSGPAFHLKSKGTAWLKDLSLTESPTGPELLWEADITRPTLGVYNQPDCFMLDQIVEAAEQSGVYLQVVLLTRDEYMSHLVKENTRDYDQAVAHARKLARYAAARWGYSTHIAAWEYFNEMNPGLPTERFYTEVGQAFEEFDINHHLRATSAWASPSKDYRHPKLETADLHYYLRPANGPLWQDEVESILARWKLMQQHASGRPILFSEFGITDNNWQRGPQLENDRQFVHLHNALWASALSGFASTVCHWYWDDIHKRDLYPLYRPISRFTADIPWTTTHLRPASINCDPALRAIGLQGDAGAYFWLQDRRATWWKIAMDGNSPDEIRNASITLAGLKPGTYAVQWWDTREGKTIAQEQVRSSNAELKIRVPPFSRDIACKVLKSDQ